MSSSVKSDVAFESLLNQYCLVDPTFGRFQSDFIELDLGAGKGGFAVEVARRYPQRLILAADIMLGRVRKTQRKATRSGVDNLVCIRADANELVGYMLPDACISRLHILCPDPWPKKRHSSRRLICSAFLNNVARILRPDGVLHLSTDDTIYLQQMKEAVAIMGIFQQDEQAIDDVRDISTEFEDRWASRDLQVAHLAYRLNDAQ